MRCKVDFISTSVQLVAMSDLTAEILSLALAKYDYYYVKLAGKTYIPSA